jgi:predicted DNA-binding transcriptional regulator YafY
MVRSIPANEWHDSSWTPDMHASRLLSILMLLQARGRMSARALAEEVETSIRTIHRDIEQLSAAGVPVRSARGREGGFELLDGWRTRLTGLTAHEARTIFMAGLPGPASELGLGEAMASARMKLLAALPDGWREDAHLVVSRFHLDPVGWFHSVPSADHLTDIAEAVWTCMRLRIRYESWKGVVDRKVEPLGLVLKAGVWYLVGRVEGDPRTYRLSSILELELLEERFERPSEFDLAGYWTESARRFETDIYRDTAVLRADPSALPRLRDLSPAAAEEAPDARGWLQVTIRIESIDHAARELLRLGSDVEVLKPAALRDRIHGTARKMAALYGRSA